MQVAFFDRHSYEVPYFERANQDFQFNLKFHDARLSASTAELVKGCDVVCAFVNDHLDQACLEKLKNYGIQLVALRCAGFNQVDLKAAKKLDLPVVRVPEYSPHAVAEFAVSLLLTLNRKIHRSYNRVRELNFSLDGLVGFDLHGKSVGVVGTGRIGKIFAEIMRGFGCTVRAYDLEKDEDWARKYQVQYVDSLDALIETSDVVSLHVPLNEQTHHLIDADQFAKLKKGAILINTGRGGLINARALVNALKSGHLGGAGLDVYEEEEGMFFEDLSFQGIQDDTLARLLTFPNVIVTSHQGFLTTEALENIAKTTLNNIAQFQKGKPLENAVVP